MKRLRLIAVIGIAMSCAAWTRAAVDFHCFSSDAEMDGWLRVNSATYAAVAQSIESREDLKGYRFSSQPDVARGMVLYRDGYIEVQLNPALSGPGRMTTLIFEVINGSRHRDHQQVDAALASGVIESAEAYGMAREMIEFEALRDPNRDGILDGPQPNTLDAAWYGEISFTSSLYLAALRAGAQMAREMGDTEFAKQCDTIADAGAKQILELFNGEYFYQKEDPKHANDIGIGEGCYIDQIFGQTWAHWVGLGWGVGAAPPVEHTWLFDRQKQLTALRSLWKYNFVPDVGPFREELPRGRWYAAAGDAGLIMCSWPKEPVDPAKKKHWQYMYFNECMSGFEWQAAAHMVYEGRDQDDLLEYGLAVSRAIHDRYDAKLRNPYNEIECSDHYARAMASYGVFRSLCGFQCHGPRGEVEFHPRLTPEQFKAPFVAAEGWGTFSQQIESGKLESEIHLKHGRLKLKRLALGNLGDFKPGSADATLAGKPVACSLQVIDGRAVITLDRETLIGTGGVFKVILG